MTLESTAFTPAASTLRAEIFKMAILGMSVVGLLLGLVASAIVFSANYSAMAASARGEELQSADVLADMLRQDAGIHGYIDTGDPRSLSLYLEGRGRTGSTLRQLQRETAGTSSAERVTAMAAAVAAWQRWAESLRLQAATPENPAVAVAQAWEQGRSLFDGFAAARGALAADLEAEFQADAGRAGAALVAAAIALLAGSAAIAGMLTQFAQRVRRVALDPLQQLTQAAMQVSQGRQAPILHADRVDEIGVLARALRGWREASQERELLIEHAPLGICRVDRHGQVVDLNHVMATTLGYQHEAALGRSYVEFIHPDDHEAAVAAYRDLVAGRMESSTMESRYVRADGSVLWCSVAYSVVRGPDGGPESFVVILEDIGERRRDADRAARVQHDLLPRSTPELDGYELAGTCLPAHDVAGDFFDWVAHEGGHLDLTVADVMGKGVAAALVMATVRAAMRAAPPELGPASRLRLAEDSLALGPDEDGLFVTLFHCRLNVATGELRYVDAGHGYCAVWRRDGRLQRLGVRSLPLGVRQDETFREGVVRLEAGDNLVVYSDGLVELADRRVELRDLLGELGRPGHAADLVQGLVGTLPVRPADDVTVVVLHRLVENRSPVASRPRVDRDGHRAGAVPAEADA